MSQLPPALLKSDVREKRGFPSQGAFPLFVRSVPSDSTVLYSFRSLLPLTTLCCRQLRTRSQCFTRPEFRSPQPEIAHFSMYHNYYTARKSTAFDLAPLIKVTFSCFCSAESYHEFFSDKLIILNYLHSLIKYLIYGYNMRWLYNG